MMKAICYLVIQGKEAQYVGGSRQMGAIKVTKTKPSTQPDEIAVRLEVDIPDNLFEKPTLELKLGIPDSVQAGGVITPELQDNIAELIKNNIGINVSVSAPEGSLATHDRQQTLTNKEETL